MKRQRPTPYINRPYKRPRLVRQDADVTAVVRKELRKKTDWKYTDYAVTQSAVYYNAAPVSLLQNLVRGDVGINNFEGNIINPQGLTVKYFAESIQSSYEAVRIMIFQWMDSATPATSGILQNTGTTTALVSPTLITNKAYIRVLYDRLHPLQPSYNGAASCSGMAEATVYIPGRKLRQIRFNSGNNTVQDGNIYVLALSDDTALGTVNLTLYSRLTFSD